MVKLSGKVTKCPLDSGETRADRNGEGDGVPVQLNLWLIPEISSGDSTSFQGYLHSFLGSSCRHGEVDLESIHTTLSTCFALNLVILLIVYTTVFCTSCMMFHKLIVVNRRLCLEPEPFLTLRGGKVVPWFTRSLFVVQ